MLTRLLADIVAVEQARLWRGAARLTLVMSLLGLAATAVVGGLIFASLGLYLSLAETMPPWQAGAIVGGGVVLLAAILLMVAALVIARQGRAVPRGGSVFERASDGPAAQLGSAIGDIIAKSNIKISDIVLTALITGMVLGASPRLRQRILARKRGTEESEHQGLRGRH